MANAKTTQLQNSAFCATPEGDLTVSTKLKETLGNKNVRVAVVVVGNVDARKSSLIGTLLTTGMLDDGRCKAPSGITTHHHEIKKGRTSTISTHTLAFHDGQLLPNAINLKQRLDGLKSETEIAQLADQVVTFMDLAGHKKYFKTTIHGISSGMANYVVILVNARHPPTHMTVHHMNICAVFGIPIPIIILFMKIDGCRSVGNESSNYS